MKKLAFVLVLGVGAAIWYNKSLIKDVVERYKDALEVDSRNQ